MNLPQIYENLEPKMIIKYTHKYRTSIEDLKVLNDEEEKAPFNQEHRNSIIGHAANNNSF
jgi:hypothetical protein